MRKRLVILGLLFVMSVNTLYGCSQGEQSDNVIDDYVAVNVEAVTKRDISEEKIFSGVIVPNKEIKIVPKIPGKVTSLNVDVGSTVGVGTALFTIDSEDLQKQVNQAKKSLDLANSQLQQAKLGPPSAAGGARLQAEQAELGYQQAISALNSARVTSPISGIVSQVNINQGEMASSAQPSLVILDTSRMFVEINVSESDITEISVAQEVKINMVSIGKIVDGQAETISPAPDERTQLYSVRFSIKDVPEEIKTGMFVKVNLNVNSKEKVIAVKSEAILEDGIKNYVYLLEEDKAVRRDVEIGIQTNEYTEVLSGLKEGEELLIKGQNYVEDGSRVKVIRGED